jgi:hypothetical protein
VVNLLNGAPFRPDQINEIMKQLKKSNPLVLEDMPVILFITIFLIINTWFIVVVVTTAIENY